MVLDMDAGDDTRTRRRGRSEAKRAAMLEAAEALFLSDGYERASVDAIAALAAVSKRTVYDHFRDKEQLFSAVMGSVTSKVTEAIRIAIEEELPADCDPGPALLSFVRRIATVTLASSEYVLFRRLMAASGSAQRRSAAASDDPADLLTARMAEFGRTGQLAVPDPRRATEHLVALTLSIAIETSETKDIDAAAIDDILTDGIDAFLRAYVPARGAGSGGP